MGDSLNGGFAGFTSSGDARDGSFLPNYNESYDGRAIALNSLKVASSVVGAIPAAGPAGSIISIVGRAVGGGLNAYDAQSAVAKLEGILLAVNASTISTTDKAKLVGCIEHLLAKQGIKFKAGVTTATGVGQPGETAYRAGKAIYKHFKGTKGKHRQESAQNLIEMLGSGDPSTKVFAEQILDAVAKADFQKIIQSTIANVFKS